MPLERHNSFSIRTQIPIDSLINSPIINRFPSKPWIVRWIILHIKPLNHWSSIDQMLQLLIIFGRLAWNYVFSVKTFESLIKFICLRRWVRNDKGVEFEIWRLRIWWLSQAETVSYGYKKEQKRYGMRSIWMHSWKINLFNFGEIIRQSVKYR